MSRSVISKPIARAKENHQNNKKFNANLEALGVTICDIKAHSSLQIYALKILMTILTALGVTVCDSKPIAHVKKNHQDNKYFNAKFGGPGCHNL